MNIVATGCQVWCGTARRSEIAPENVSDSRRSWTTTCAIGARPQRWSQFLRQRAKVDSPMQRMSHHEDSETVFG